MTFSRITFGRTKRRRITHMQQNDTQYNKLNDNNYNESYQNDSKKY